MARWTNLAQWVGPTVNRTTGGQRRVDGLVIHIAEGSYAGTIAWQRNPNANVSSHFVVARDGRIAQMVDTADAAWTQREGNGEWLSIENEGFVAQGLSPQQIDANAALFAETVRRHGVPAQLTGTPARKGLGHHSMGVESGYDWGHPQCPGALIKSQKQAVLNRAIQLLGGAPPTSGGILMALTEEQQADLALMAYRFNSGDAGPRADDRWNRNLPNTLLSAVSALRADLTALKTTLAAVVQSGGSTDAAAVIAAMERLASEDKARDDAHAATVANLAARIAELETELAEQHQRQAAAAQAAADALTDN